MEKKETYNEEQKTQIQIKELGTRLKSIREAQGLSIADVSDVTKIQKHYLAAIEEGDLDHLPKGPYVRSFVRQYCDHLSAPDIWKSYDVITKKQKAAAPTAPAGDETNYSDSRKVFKPRSFVWLYLLIALSLGAAGWITWQYRGDITGSAKSHRRWNDRHSQGAEAGRTGGAPVGGRSSPACIGGCRQQRRADRPFLDGRQTAPAGDCSRNSTGASVRGRKEGCRSQINKGHG